MLRGSRLHAVPKSGVSDVIRIRLKTSFFFSPAVVRRRRRRGHVRGQKQQAPAVLIALLHSPLVPPDSPVRNPAEGPGEGVAPRHRVA